MKTRLLSRLLCTAGASSEVRAKASPASPAKLLVSELFPSIQGEGPFTGRPSVFLRLGVCNLSCAWCDTPYTWLFSKSRQEKVTQQAGASAQPRVFSRRDELKRRSVDDVLYDVFRTAGPGIRSLVVTGGEPLLHAKPLEGLLVRVLGEGFSVEIETNGTVRPVGVPREVHLNVSPKLENSRQGREVRIKPEVIKECLQFPSSVLKFVVGEEEDVDEVAEIVAEAGVAPERVYLMPLGTVRAEMKN